MKKNLQILLMLTFLLMITNSFAQSSVVMNEIYSRGVPGNLDWIEIYNSSSSPIDISGYKIYDIGGQSGTKNKKLFPSGTIIPAQGFYVIITDTADFAGDNSGFGLSSNGETVWLEDAAGNLIDNVTFPSMALTQTYGRYPDGSSNWQLLDYITRGAPNSITSIEDNTNLNLDFKLEQNYPNPFNPITTITYKIGKQSLVTLKVFDILGKEVTTLVNEVKSPGSYIIKFDGNELSSGIYFYELKTENFTSIKKLMLMK